MGPKKLMDSPKESRLQRNISNGSVHNKAPAGMERNVTNKYHGSIPHFPSNGDSWNIPEETKE